MQPPLPFRTEPRVTTSQLSAQPNRHNSKGRLPVDELLQQIDDVEFPSSDLVRRIVTHPDERVAIKAVTKWKGLVAGLRRGLYKRGRRVCQHERILWHPLFDAMAMHGCWPQAGDLDAASRKAYGQKYSIDDHLEPLARWIAAQTDPKALHPLLEFRSDEVRKLLAREARVMDDVLFDRLRTSGKNVARAMAENKYMPLEYRTRLMNTCWETYRKARKGTKRYVYERVFVLTMLKAAITQGPGLPPSTRAAILAHLRRARNPDPELVNIIVQDPEATRDDIRRILKFLSTRNAVDVILRERVHDSDMKALLKTLKVAEKVVEAPNPPPASLDWILHLHSNDEGLVTRIARHPAAPVSTLLSIAHRCMHQSYSLMTLAKRAEAREHPRIRSILVSVPSANVAESLLPYANSTEYPLLLNKIAGQSIKRALDLLESQPPPPNTRFPVELIQLLVSAPDRELRIRAIVLATQYNDGQSQTVTTERQHQATNVRRQ